MFQRQQSTTRGQQTAFIEEMIGNQKVVKAFGLRRKGIMHDLMIINNKLQKYSPAGCILIVVNYKPCVPDL